MNFYTLREAAAAIAAEMHPDNESNRAEAARCYVAALENAVGTNGIVYRNAVTRWPLHRVGIAASLAAHSCVLSELDLNAWLDSQGVGVRVAGPDTASGLTMLMGENAKAGIPALQEKPTSAELASVLGPYLSNGRDSEWLKLRLQDADRYPRLKKYRSLEVEGERRIARWDAGPVALHLIESGELTIQLAKEALAKHYPLHLYVLPTEDRKPETTWLSGLQGRD